MTLTATVTLEDVVAGARALAARIASGASPAAAAWVLRNRASVAFAHRRETGQVHPVFGDGSLAGAAGSADAAQALAPQVFWRAAAALCAVLSGDISDPTDGSTDWRTILGHL
jgi:hypothetical protein